MSLRTPARRTRVHPVKHPQAKLSHVKGHGVSLLVCCGLIGWSVRTAERALADGTFPVPHLKRRVDRRGSPYRFSTYDIEAYLRENATQDANVGGR